MSEVIADFQLPIADWSGYSIEFGHRDALSAGMQGLETLGREMDL